jgi:hypothetical protein
MVVENDSIVEDHEDIFDSPDEDIRRRVDIKSLPLVDEEGHEINIYDADGYRIPRRLPRHRRTTSSCGLLADLTRVRSLFRPEVDMDIMDMDVDEIGENLEQDHLTLNVYPQAFLRQFGHFQANDVPRGFNPILRTINRRLASRVDIDSPIVSGVACQGYNHIQHSLTELAGGLEVVHGRVTAALAGVKAGAVHAKRAHTKIFNSNKSHRPYDRVKEKLSKSRGLSRAFRLEPVFTVNVEAIRITEQTGR